MYQVNTSSDSFFLNESVEDCCYKPIKERFKVLLDSKKIIQQNLADDLRVDKAYISRIINGVEIPPHHMRIKIASYFNVDSSTIWRLEDLPYVRSLRKKRFRGDNNGKN